MKLRVGLIATAMTMSTSIAAAYDFECMNSCRTEASRCGEEAQTCNVDCKNEWQRGMEEPMRRAGQIGVGGAGGGVAEMSELMHQQGVLGRELDRCREACTVVTQRCRRENQRCESQCTAAEAANFNAAYAEQQARENERRQIENERQQNCSRLIADWNSTVARGNREKTREGQARARAALDSIRDEAAPYKCGLPRY